MVIGFAACLETMDRLCFVLLPVRFTTSTICKWRGVAQITIRSLMNTSFTFS